MFRDNFTNFVFNDIDSKSMKVWITNSRDLQDILIPAGQDTFITQSDTDGRIYTGTKIESQTLSVKCAAIEITDKERRNIKDWLNPRATGALIFGFDKYHYYDVKVSGEIVADRWVRGRYHKELGGYTYIYNFTVKFTTTNDWAKLGVPVNIDLNSLKRDSLQPLSQITTSFGEDSSKTEKILNNYNNYFNAYSLPFVVSTSRAMIHQGPGHQTSSDQNSWKNVQDIADYFDRKDNQTQDFYYDYYFIEGTGATVTISTYSLTTICNPGLEPMYFSYVYLPKETETAASLSSFIYTLELDGSTLYNFEATQRTCKDLYYDSYVGSLLSEGSFIPLLSDIGLSQTSYLNEGQSSIPSGHPETIQMKDKFTIRYETLKANEEGGWEVHKPLIPFIEFNYNPFVFQHLGFCHFSFFDTMPQSSHGYSIDSDIVSTKNHNIFSGTGYFCSRADFSNIAEAGIQLKDDTQFVLFINCKVFENKIIPDDDEKYEQGQTMIYKYMSICDAHVVNVKNNSINIENDLTNNYHILKMQTRGN